MPEQFNVGQRQIELKEELGRTAVDRVEQDARVALVPWAATAFQIEHLDGLQSAAEGWRSIGSGTLDPLQVLMVTP